MLRNFEWHPVSLCNSMQLKTRFVKLSLMFITICECIWICPVFFLFNLKEKCLSGDPVYWFPLRDQQSRRQCVLAVRCLCWIHVCKGLSLCRPVPAVQRPLLLTAVCGRGLAAHSVLSGQLYASSLDGNRGSLLCLVTRGSSAFRHCLFSPSQGFSEFLPGESARWKVLLE